MNENDGSTDNASVISIHGPLGPMNSGAFKFYNELKTRHYWVKFVVKSMLKPSGPWRLATMKTNNCELRIILIKYEREVRGFK